MADLHSEATRQVESLMFQMTSGVTQLKRLVDCLGTSKDTIELRHKLTAQHTKVQSAAKSIKEQLTGLGQQRQQQALDKAQQDKINKLMQDFQAILLDYKETQKVAVQKEASSLPRQPTPTPSSSAAAAQEPSTSGRSDADIESQALLQQQQQVEVRALDNAITFNESLIEERDHSIAEIQQQIGEVNEMFQDLAVLIHDQGQQLQTVDLQIVNVAQRVQEGGTELVKAERSQRSARNKCLLLWLICGLVVAVLIIILFA